MAEPVDKTSGKSPSQRTSQPQSQEVKYKGRKYSLEVQQENSDRTKTAATESFKKTSTQDVDTKGITNREIKRSTPYYSDSEIELDVSESEIDGIEDVDFEKMTDAEIDAYVKNLTKSTASSETKELLEAARFFSNKELADMQGIDGVASKDEETGKYIAVDFNLGTLNQQRDKVAYCNSKKGCWYFVDSPEGRAAEQAQREGKFTGRFQDPEKNDLITNNYQSMTTHFVDIDKWDHFVKVTQLLHTAKTIEKVTMDLPKKSEEDLKTSTLHERNIEILSQKETLISKNLAISILSKLGYYVSKTQEILDFQKYLSEKNENEKQELYFEKQREIRNDKFKKDDLKKEIESKDRKELGWSLGNKGTFSRFLLQEGRRILFIRGKLSMK